MWHYKEMKLNKIILTLFFLLTAYFVQGQSNKISHTLTFEYIEGCETGKGECYPVNINRKTINDSILIYFPNGGTISDVYLYSDSIFNNWINKTVDNPEFLRHDKKYANQGLLKIDMTGLSDGKYRAHMLACGLGGIIEINLKTINSECIHPIDTIDGMTVLTLVEKMPEYKGGDQELMKYLATNIKYPTTENDDDLQFKIFATFVIDTVGKVRNPCILRPKYADRLTPIETEILRVIESMHDWVPGMINEKKVPVRYTMPINISWR